jgi:hypothetical protein
MMGNDRFARYGAATGIIFLILFGVGFSVFAGDAPDTNAPAEEWATWYGDHESRIQTGLTLVGVGLFFFVWFLGSLRSALAVAEGGGGRLASVAYGGGILSAAFFMVAVASAAAAAFHAGEVDPAITQALNDLGLVVGAPAAAGVTALFGATAIVGYRHGAVPAPVAGFSALAAITQPLAFGVAVTESGAFAADGVLGLWVPVATFVVAILALSVALIRAPVPRPAAP